jgi:hypothetical protein
MRSMSLRLVGWIVAIILGAFLFGWVKSTRRNYWLLRDCQEGVAVVTKESWAGRHRVSLRKKRVTKSRSRSPASWAAVVKTFR